MDNVSLRKTIKMMVIFSGFDKNDWQFGGWLGWKRGNFDVGLSDDKIAKCRVPSHKFQVAGKMHCYLIGSQQISELHLLMAVAAGKNGGGDGGNR